MPALISDCFRHWESRKGGECFLRQPHGDTWNNYTWDQVGGEARRVVACMQHLGLRQGDRVSILSQNCAEWIICDLACLFGGYLSVPLYANVNAETMQTILKHSEVKLLLIGKLLPVDWEGVKYSIPSDVMTFTMRGYEKEGIDSWKKFITTTSTSPKEVSISPDDTLTIIYTSGTTGTPKGVVHTHRTIMNAIRAAEIEVRLDIPGNRFFSYLPLSHAAERGVVEFGAIFSGGSISFIESVDTFAENIRATRPTHFFGVPRIWEKFQTRILKEIPQSLLNVVLLIPGISTLVKSRIRKGLGLKDAIVMLTGAAPISPDLLRWFTKLGIEIREGYGMSENFNVCSITPAGASHNGSAGKLFDNQEIIIDPETKEILQRCSWIMKEYYKDPELTANTIQNGFLHTGDMGEVSADNCLTISGRVKDIFKTSKGEYIVPGKIELEFLSLPEVDQACVLGSLYPQPFVIVVLSPLGRTSDHELVAQHLTKTLSYCNQKLMGYEKLRKVILVNDEWTTSNLLLTPTLKMKRNALASRYEARLKAQYEEEGDLSIEPKPKP